MEIAAPVAHRAACGAGRGRVTDGDLLQRIADGDDAAFDILYRRFARPLYGLALRMLRDRGRAEDAVQETFAVDLALGARSYRPERGPGAPWLYAVARNAIVDRCRARGEPTFADPPEAVSPDAGPDEQAEPATIVVARASRRRGPARARARGARARLLGRSLAERGRAVPRHPARHRQDAHAQRPSRASPTCSKGSSDDARLRRAGRRRPRPGGARAAPARARRCSSQPGPPPELPPVLASRRRRRRIEVIPFCNRRRQRWRSRLLAAALAAARVRRRLPVGRQRQRRRSRRETVVPMHGTPAAPAGATRRSPLGDDDEPATGRCSSASRTCRAQTSGLLQALADPERDARRAVRLVPRAGQDDDGPSNAPYKLRRVRRLGRHRADATAPQTAADRPPDGRSSRLGRDAAGRDERRVRDGHLLPRKCSTASA